jgi:hypothetical protein
LITSELVDKIRKSKRRIIQIRGKPIETETDMFTPVYRACRNRERAYHHDINCSFLKMSNSIKKTRLGSVLAAGYRKHC